MRLKIVNIIMDLKIKGEQKMSFFLATSARDTFVEQRTMTQPFFYG